MSLFQSSEPLVHRLFGEMLALVHKHLGRFMKMDLYKSKIGKNVLSLQPQSSVNCKSKVEIGEDTEAAMASWEAAEERLSGWVLEVFIINARSICCQACP